MARSAAARTLAWVGVRGGDTGKEPPAERLACALVRPLAVVVGVALAAPLSVMQHVRLVFAEELATQPVCVAAQLVCVAAQPVCVTWVRTRGACVPRCAALRRTCRLVAKWAPRQL